MFFFSFVGRERGGRCRDNDNDVWMAQVLCTKYGYVVSAIFPTLYTAYQTSELIQNSHACLFSPVAGGYKSQN